MLTEAGVRKILNVVNVLQLTTVGGNQSWQFEWEQTAGQTVSGFNWMYYFDKRIKVRIGETGLTNYSPSLISEKKKRALIHRLRKI